MRTSAVASDWWTASSHTATHYHTAAPIRYGVHMDIRCTDVTVSCTITLDSMGYFSEFRA